MILEKYYFQVEECIFAIIFNDFFRLGHRKYKVMYKQYFRQALKENYLKENYLEYFDDKSLATLSEQKGLVVVQKQLEREEKHKHDNEIVSDIKRVKADYVKYYISEL